MRVLALGRVKIEDDSPSFDGGDGGGPITIRIVLNVEEPPREIEPKEERGAFWLGVLMGWLIGG